MRAFSYLAGALALLATTSDVGAQFPGELRGDVVDVLSGRPVASAVVRVAGVSATTDAAGAFHLRGLEPGEHRLSVIATGFLAAERPVVVENGTVTDVHLEVVPDVVEVEGVVARVDRAPTGVRTLSGAELRAVPARTVGEIAASLPGVTIASRGPGAAEVPSIRGSGGDAVLVLVDGVPINDPVTGEADLSTLPAATVSAIHVLPGGRSARYGARAEGGVILVETGGGERSGVSLGGAVGSLGRRALDGSWRGFLWGGALSVAAGLDQLDGRFKHDVPAEAGGGRATRENAFADGQHGRLGWSVDGRRSSLGLTLSGERLQRGLPGRSFAPSEAGRQELERVRASGRWDWTPDEPWRLGASAYVVSQAMEHRDPAPPFGNPFDERTTLRGAGSEVQASYHASPALRLASGLDVAHLEVRSSQLADGMGTVGRTDVGAWLTVSGDGPSGTSLSATARLDRSGLPARFYASHDLGLGWAGALGARVRLAHRSSFSPPTLGDQFFREGVGVEPNPDLRAERVPSEWAASLGWEGETGGLVIDAEAEAYLGDIQGMIVWLPDFRFVWSPRNHDVRRRGLELSARLRQAGSGWDLRGHAAWNRTTYDRPGLEDAQVVYRPELSGGGVVAWSGARWAVSVSTQLVGARYPVPNRVNRLPPFWTTDVALSRRWDTSLGPLGIGLSMDRAFDNEDSLIFAYPEPGRTVRLTARLGG
ncbi:MAG: TonB-dependent receptor plug domain-containing protein [Gemmatimonadota bacterium]